jgi:hypothetical protein
MKCTSCGTIVKPIVAVDIDGTLGNYHAHFEDFAEEYFDRVIRPGCLYRGGESMSAWAIRELGITRAAYRDCKLAYRQGGLKRTMPLFDGAKGLCERIRAAGGELWLTTTRPYLRLDNVDPDTREWLRRKGIQYDHLLYDENKYQVLHDRLTDPDRVVAIVDDLVTNISEAQHIFRWDKAMWIRTQWNEKDGGGGIGLEGVAPFVETKIKEWIHSHE